MNKIKNYQEIIETSIYRQIIKWILLFIRTYLLQQIRTRPIWSLEGFSHQNYTRQLCGGMVQSGCYKITHNSHKQISRLKIHQNKRNAFTPFRQSKSKKWNFFQNTHLTINYLMWLLIHLSFIKNLRRRLHKEKDCEWFYISPASILHMWTHTYTECMLDYHNKHISQQKHSEFSKEYRNSSEQCITILKLIPRCFWASQGVRQIEECPN